MSEEALAKAVMPEGYTMDEIKSDVAKIKRAEAEDREFDRKAEAEFRSHRGLKDGRNFLWNVFRWQTKSSRDKYRENFDLAFPDSPGAGL